MRFRIGWRECDAPGALIISWKKGKAAMVKSRKQFMEEQGATCKNWYNSWSFINKKKKIIYFGAWEDKNGVIFSEDWERGDNGRKKPGYKQSMEHINLIENEGYTLKIYWMKSEKETLSGGTRKIDSFNPELFEAEIYKDGRDWKITLV